MQSMLPSATLSRRAPRYSIAALTACAAFGFGSAFAAPAVTGVTGTVANGGQVTINGSGFGTKSKAAPMVWDTIDDVSSYSSITNLISVPTGTSYMWDENAGVKIARPTTGRTASSSAQYQSSGGNVWLGHPIGAGAQSPPSSIRELFVSYWVKYPQTPYETANNASHKFLRIRAGDEQDLRISWTQLQVFVNNPNAGGDSAIVTWSHEDPWSKNISAWHLHEFWVSADSGQIRAWVDGQLLHDWSSTDARYLKKVHPAGLELALLGWNPSHGTKSNLSWSMDDVVVDSTRARVLLSKAPRWVDSKAHEYQPATTWSSGQISVKLNLGQFSASDSLYLYVMNPNGEVNAQGFPVAECEKCPKPPTNVTVN